MAHVYSIKFKEEACQFSRTYSGMEFYIYGRISHNEQNNDNRRILTKINPKAGNIKENNEICMEQNDKSRSGSGI